MSARGRHHKPPTEHLLYMAFVQAAVYDAVVGVDGRNAPIQFMKSPAPGAQPHPIPSTEINLADTDGNPATDPDPSWAPLRPNPA